VLDGVRANVQLAATAALCRRASPALHPRGAELLDPNFPPFTTFHPAAASLCAVGLAARTTGRPATRRLLLEPVLASLTSQRRSLAGVTQRNVDRSLDLLMDTVFTPIFIR